MKNPLFSSFRFKLAALCVCLMALLGVFGQQIVRAQSSSEAQPVYLYYFWQVGCSHCEEAKPYLQDYQTRYPNLVIRAYELHAPQGQAVFTKMLNAYQVPNPRGTPTFILGDQYWVGSSESTMKSIEDAISQCGQTACADAGTAHLTANELQAAGPLDPAASSNSVGGLSPIWIVLIVLAILLLFIFLPQILSKLQPKRAKSSAGRRKAKRS